MDIQEMDIQRENGRRGWTLYKENRRKGWTLYKVNGHRGSQLKLSKLNHRHLENFSYKFVILSCFRLRRALKP